MKSLTILKTLVAAVSMSMLLGSCVVHREHHGPPPPKKHKKHKKPKPPKKGSLFLCTIVSSYPSFMPASR